MKVENIVKRLAEKFGADSVFIRSEFHIQVQSSKGLNDIWLNKHGELKAKAYGNRNVLQNCSLESIIKKFGSQSKSHIEIMKEILDLSKVVKFSEKLANQYGILIFSDAGFKDGKAKIAAVFVDGTDVTMKSRLIECNTISDAEHQAISLGLSMSETATIYNDNLGVVNSYNDNRIRWVPREQNKFADSFGNMRQS